MASMTFRFTTECEMTLEAASYEEAYLRFKDFMRGQPTGDFDSVLNVLPPESVQIFFQTDHENHFHEIGEFKGDFHADIVTRCGPDNLICTGVRPSMWQFREICLDGIPEVYW